MQAVHQPNRINVLVVDDDLAHRVLATIVLAREGYSPTAVGNVPRALERVAEGGVGVVLTDLMMPALDGFDLLEALRGSRSSPPVVAMTASDEEDLTARAFALGARTVLRKPLEGDELAGAIRDPVGTARAAA
jgi:CheY-like chemotaxis protein